MIKINQKYYSKKTDATWNNRDKTKKQRNELKYRGSLLNKRMAYPLELKIAMAKQRIQYAINLYGQDSCYIGFSGGKDSTVLSHLVNSMGYKIEHVYSNTRLEYPECISFAKKWCEKNDLKLTFVLPDMLPTEVWKKYGYPMFSKDAAETLERIRRGLKVNEKKRNRVRNLLKYKKVKLSSKCCQKLKKEPMKKWQKLNNKKVAILGTRAKESQMRRTVWVRKGCVYENHNNVICNPLIFWTEDDIKEYAKMNDIKFADIYYMGMERNGCYACGFGCHLTEENNFIKLKKYNPNLHANIMDKWGFRDICKKCDVKIE